MKLILWHYENRLKVQTHIVRFGSFGLNILEKYHKY